MRKLFLSLALFVGTLSVAAQGFDMMSVVPNDPEVRQGVLDNGAHYYIRKNSKDPQRANFHILYKVGAVLEEDRQDGLAHFLEHMAFNGSDSFQGNGLIDYCQSIGIEFGTNINAATGQEATTYMITDVPIVREGIVDSMLLVLHDWAGYITLAEKDIDDERGVISQEWAMGEAKADTRIRKKVTELVNGADHIYTQRDVIGPIDNIKNFPYQDIRDFYHKWYRPDLQAFVIVGDFDPEVMEQKLIKTMSNVSAFEEQTPLPKVEFPANKEPRFGVFTDRELKQSSVNFICKLRKAPIKYNNTFMSEMTTLLDQMCYTMINDRMAEMAQTPNCNFQSAGVWRGKVNNVTDYFTFSAYCAQGKELPAFESTYTEVLRAVRGGFAVPELERVKTKFLSYVEQGFNRRNDRTNTEYVELYKNNFYENKPFAPAELERDYTTAMINAITLDEVNAQIASMLTDENQIVYIQTAEKEGLVIPTTDELKESYDKVKASEIAPYTEEVIVRPLLDATTLKGSKVVKQKDGKFESTVLTLKNGVKVVLKPTDYAADEIRFQASRKGGSSTIEDLETLYSMNLMGAFDGVCGISDFTNTEFMRALNGKQCGVAPFLGSLTEGFHGSSTVKDLETMLQMLYLYSTAPRAEAEDWDMMMKKIGEQVEASKNDPMRIFQETASSTIYGNDPRLLPMSEEYLSKVSLEKYKAEYARRFSYVNNMTFFFTGSFDVEAIKPLIEKYIGSMPVVKKAPKAKSGKHFSKTVEGEIVNHFTTPQATQSTMVVILATGDVKYNLKNAVNYSALGQILETIYTRTIREEAGGVYSVQNTMSVSQYPDEKFTNQCLFLTDSTRYAELIPLVQAGIDQIVENGPTADQLQKITLAMDKNFVNGLRNNAVWQNYLVDYYILGDDNYTDYEEALKSITPASVQKAAKDAFSQGNRVELVQLP